MAIVKKRITVSLPEQLLALYRAEANKRGYHLGEMLRIALDEYMREHHIQKVLKHGL